MNPNYSMENLIRSERERVSRLRMQMLEMHPFWGYLLLQLRLVPSPELPSFAATDCITRIWYNPLYTRHLRNQQLGFVLAHEIGHLLFASEDRRRGRNRQLWNCATDYAINRIVADIQRPGSPPRPLYESPDGRYPDIGEIEILHDSKYDGMIAETIYERLLDEDLEEPVTVTVVIGGEDAEGAGASRRIIIPTLADHGGGIDIHLPETLTPAQRDEVRGRIVGAVETWKEMKERGHLPGNLVRDLVEKRKAHIPWQRIFRRFAGQALAKDDYSLARPNKRYLDYDIVVPGLYSEKAGRIAVALDTSGSMSDEELALVGAELRELGKLAEEMLLIVADADIREVVPFDRLDAYLDRGRFSGGGGTDHRPVFAYLEEHRIAPELFVGLTDLYSIFPERRPPYPVIWVVPKDHAPAPWGMVVEVSP